MTPISRRLYAYIFDLLLVGFLISVITTLIPNKTSNQFEKNLNILNQKLTNNDITMTEYYHDYSLLSYQNDYQNLKYTFITFLGIVGYFVFLPYFNRGKTIGMIINKTKIKSDTLTLQKLMLRNLIVSGVAYYFLLLIFTLTLPDNIYFTFVIILGIIQIILEIISLFMVIYRKDKRGLQDLLSHTDIVIEES